MKMYLKFKNAPYKNMASVSNHDGRLFLSKFIKRKYIGGIFFGLILSKQNIRRMRWDSSLLAQTLK